MRMGQQTIKLIGYRRDLDLTEGGALAKDERPPARLRSVLARARLLFHIKLQKGCK